MPSTSTSCGWRTASPRFAACRAAASTGRSRDRERSAKNQIVAPRIFAYHVGFTGDGWDASKPQTPETAREWVRFVAGKGVDGLKLFAFDPPRS